MRIANKDARKFVQQRLPFQGSNMFAEYFCPYPEDSSEGQHGYVVYSYGKHFPMYICLHIGGRDIWFANEDMYSRSTTRHQSQAHPLCPTVLLSTEWMKRLVQGGYRELVKARIVEGVAV